MLFSLLAIMAVAVFMTSCGQEEVIENTNNDLTELTQKLANDENFKAIQEFDNDVIEAIESGKTIEEITLTIEDERFTLTQQLLENIPELEELDAEILETVLANTYVVEADFRNPCQTCRDAVRSALRACSNAAYAVYLANGGGGYNSANYQAYVNAYNTYCIPEFYATIALCSC